MIARAIARRGGLEPREYLLKSAQKNEKKIVDILGDGVRVAIARS